MQRKEVTPDLNLFPQRLHPLLEKSRVFDSSCSPEARVWFVDTGPGFYLKRSPAGTLKTEGEMDRFFHDKGFGPRVEDYFTETHDWLLTEAVPGEDCTHPRYLEDPKRLCETTATLLRRLHETQINGCPVPNRTETYLKTVERGFTLEKWEPELFAGCWDFSGPEEAIALVKERACHLKQDTLLHGDYCLPNIMLRDWALSGFIDLGCGGVGDRHIDILWGVWTLQFNLHTNKWKDRFLDAYGRESLEEEMLPMLAACEMLGYKNRCRSSGQTVEKPAPPKVSEGGDV